MTIINARTLEDVEIWVPNDLVREVTMREKFRKEALLTAIMGKKQKSQTARTLVRHYQKRIDAAIRKARLHVL